MIATQLSKNLQTMKEFTLSTGTVVNVCKSGYFYIQGDDKPLLGGSLILRNLATYAEIKLIISMKNNQ